MQLQTEVSRQNEPKGNLLLLPCGGHHLSQSPKDLFFEAEFKEFLLIGSADDLYLIELTPPEGFQNLSRMMFDDGQVDHLVQSVDLLGARKGFALEPKCQF